MPKKYGIFVIIVILVLSGLFVYMERNRTGVVDKNAQQSAQKLVEDYKKGVKNIWGQYQVIEPSPKKEKVLNLRDKLLGLTVPSEFSQAHLDFIIGLSLLEEGLKANNKTLMEKGRKRIEKFKQDNKWLTF